MQNPEPASSDMANSMPAAVPAPVPAPAATSVQPATPVQTAEPAPVPQPSHLAPPPPPGQSSFGDATAEVPAEKKSPVMAIIMAVLILAILGVGAYVLISRNSSGNTGEPAVTPTVRPAVTTKVQGTPGTVIGSTPAATFPPGTPTGTIGGEIMYPGEGIPSLRLCAVNTATKAETCTDLAQDSTVYELTVKPASYYVYAKVIGDTTTAYYVNCDKSTSLKCDDQSWTGTAFICYQHADCKQAFTPAVVTVTEGKKSSGVTINQGWYLPCSATECPNNVDNPARWQYYLP